MTSEKIHIFTDTIPIRWRDVDPYNIVNHSAYFTYMEESRWNWFYSLTLKNELTIITPIVDAHISFKKPLIYPGNAIIKIYCERPSEKSWSIYHEIFSDEEMKILCAEATVKFVSFDPKIKRVIPIPREIKSHLYPQNEAV